MKPLSPNHSSRQLRFALFCIGFVVMGGVALAIWGGLYVMLKQPPFGWQWIIFAALTLGWLLYRKGPSQDQVLEAQQLQRDQAITVCGHHPEFGPYIHRPYRASWSASPPLPDGRRMKVIGHGLAPSADEAKTWILIGANIETLVAKASAELLPCPDLPSLPQNTYVEPTSIEILQDGSFRIDFTSVPDSSEQHIWPSAHFSASLELITAEWKP